MRSPKELTEGLPLCPSDNAQFGARALTLDEVTTLKQDFVDAAVRAKKCGYNGVELHGAHGYILSQFLSKEINKRTDNYGGSLANHSRLLFEITDEIRDAGQFPFNLDDNNDQPYQNLNLHRNARVYLNSIFSLSYYRNKNSNFYSSDIETKKLCVIGGAHALSWSNISNPSINIDVKFLYTDFFDLTNNKYDFSLIDYSSIVSIRKVFVPDAFFFLHNLENQNNVTDKTMLNTQENLTDLISELKKNFCEDLTIITIPAPSEKTFSSFNSDLIPEYINAINEAILSNDNGVKSLDINKYMKTSNLFTEDSNLINNYFVKPEFIVKLIEKDLLS